MSNPITYSLNYERFIGRTLTIPTYDILITPNGVQYIVYKELTIEGNVYILGELVIL